MRIITINLNGIRSAATKGFFEWVHQQQADVICVQEIRAQEIQLQTKLFELEGYHSYFSYALKKGYSGVGIYTRHKPQQVISQLGWQLADEEGRYVAIDLGSVWVASIYLPSGTSGEIRQAHKYTFLDEYTKYLQKCQQQKHSYIICGDLNIAHKAIDLKNWRGNQKNSGFLPEERAWLDRLFSDMGYLDAFRLINQEAEQYTWWSNRGRAWEKNVGWRIDYQVISQDLKPFVKQAQIFKEQRFSDHAPLIMDYEI